MPTRVAVRSLDWPFFTVLLLRQSNACFNELGRNTQTYALMMRALAAVFTALLHCSSLFALTYAAVAAPEISSCRGTIGAL